MVFDVKTKRAEDLMIIIQREENRQNLKNKVKEARLRRPGHVLYRALKERGENVDEFQNKAT